MEKKLKLFLFSTDLSLAKQAETAGVDSIIVDWEQKGKGDRQTNYATEINCDTPEDVAALAEVLTIPVTVRINALDENSDREIKTAIDNGAKIIMLPMAEHPSEIERFIKLVNGRAETAIQIETQPLVEHCHSLRDLGWSFAYIGLNDLMISRQSKWLWEGVADGTVERIFDILSDRQVGFGGVTVIGGGKPIPFVELLSEMARLGCHLSFLRRSFKREIQGRDLNAEIEAVGAVWSAACRRQPEAILQDHKLFMERIQETRSQVYPSSPSPTQVSA
ncbi:aldolase/citrate lyase family protein [Aerosakkonemataceae cyanobacterium BLCC-F50]|uniref:Aldolase/citrate lyase family protein n=1 Tax=Floridaenema flaviceps BLCC-F50 TaxID=3153642 RepID=A0ABV4XP53_9CYAN